MQFVLADLAVINGARYVDRTDGDGNVSKQLVITVHITSKCDAIPYVGKFQQVDYNIDLDLDDTILPSALNEALPQIAQVWITNKYPNI